MHIDLARCTLKPLLLCLAAGAVAAAAVVTQTQTPARTHVAVPAGAAQMRLLRDEHEIMRTFLAAQDAKQRMAAAIESEPEPDQSIVVADVAPATARAAIAKHAKPVRLVRAPAVPPISILPLPPPIALAQMPPAPEPPRAANSWVHDATRLPGRLWAAVGELMDERPPIPPRPIPPV